MHTETDRTVRFAVLVLGLLVLIAGVFVLFTQTPLAEWVPAGVVIAVVLLITGIAVMIWSDRIAGPVAVERDVVVDRERTTAYPTYPRGEYRYRETRVEEDDL